MIDLQLLGFFFCQLMLCCKTIMHSVQLYVLVVLVIKCFALFNTFNFSLTSEKTSQRSALALISFLWQLTTFSNGNLLN